MQLMVQASDRCHEKVSARLYLQHGQQYINLSAFDDVLKTNLHNLIVSQLPPCSMLQSLSLYLREFSGEDVGMITKAFSEMVGRGSFGIVYKGEVGLTKVAVKLIDPVSVCSMCSFYAERSAKSEVKKKRKIRENVKKT